MIQNLVEWANSQKETLEKIGIRTNKVSYNDYGGYIDHETINCFGRISLNVEGHIDIEIIEIESEINLMTANYMFQSDFFTDVVQPYLRILKESTKKIQSKFHMYSLKKIE